MGSRRNGVNRRRGQQPLGRPALAGSSSTTTATNAVVVVVVVSTSTVSSGNSCHLGNQSSTRRHQLKPAQQTGRRADNDCGH